LYRWFKWCNRAKCAPNRDVNIQDSSAHLVDKVMHMRRMTSLAHHPFHDARGALMMLQFVSARLHAILPKV